jgi:hypothetical protein
MAPRKLIMSMTPFKPGHMEHTDYKIKKKKNKKRPQCPSASELHWLRGQLERGMSRGQRNRSPRPLISVL